MRHERHYTHDTQKFSIAFGSTNTTNVKQYNKGSVNPDNIISSVADTVAALDKNTLNYLLTNLLNPLYTSC